MLLVSVSARSARIQELEEQQPGVEEELRRLLEKPGELLHPRPSFQIPPPFGLSLNFATTLLWVRPPEVPSGAAAGGDADAAAGGDRGRQERHRGRSGRRQTEVEVLHS